MIPIDVGGVEVTSIRKALPVAVNGVDITSNMEILGIEISFVLWCHTAVSSYVLLPQSPLRCSLASRSNRLNSSSSSFPVVLPAQPAFKCFSWAIAT